MGRHITVTVDCDWPSGCDVHAVEGDGRVIPRTLSIDGKQAKEFLLCKTHLDELDELLLALMQKGIKVGTAAKAPSKGGRSSGDTPTTPPGSSDSLICKADVDGRPCGRQLHNRTGMAQHVIRTHDYDDLATYEAEFGAVTNT
jgi:hypothetical protein